MMLEEAIRYQKNKEFEKAKIIFDQILIHNSNNPQLLSQYSILLFEMGLLDKAIENITKALSFDASELNFLNNRAYYYFIKRDFDKSLIDYESILKLNPLHDDTFNNIGRVFNKKQKFEEAINQFNQAIKINPNKYHYYYNRGNSYLRINKNDEAIEDFTYAIKLNKSHYKSYHNRALAFENLLKFDKAIDDYCHSIQISNYNESLIGLSFVYLIKGDYQKGWELHERRFLSNEFKKLNKFENKEKLWSGAPEDLNEKTILIHHEQGLGDTIQFCRYLKGFKDMNCKVVVKVQKPLVDLIQSLDSEFTVIPHDHSFLDYDYYCPIMSLPYAFRANGYEIPNQTPYLDIPSIKVEQWESLLGPKNKLRIGLAWRGNPNQKNDFKRSFKIEDTYDLFTDQFEWISLHNDLTSSEKETIKKSNIKDTQDRQSSFMDVAAICKNVDILLTVDTSYAHLAGSLNKQVLLMIPYYPDFRWLLDRTDTPWYPNTNLIRHSQNSTWREIIQETVRKISN